MAARRTSSIPTTATATRTRRSGESRPGHRGERGSTHRQAVQLWPEAGSRAAPTAGRPVQSSGRPVGLPLGRSGGLHYRLPQLEVTPGQLRGPVQAIADVPGLQLRDLLPVHGLDDLVPAHGTRQDRPGLQALARVLADMVREHAVELREALRGALGKFTLSLARGLPALMRDAQDTARGRSARVRRRSRAVGRPLDFRPALDLPVLAVLGPLRRLAVVAVPGPLRRLEVQRLSQLLDRGRADAWQLFQGFRPLDFALAAQLEDLVRKLRAHTCLDQLVAARGMYVGLSHRWFPLRVRTRNGDRARPHAALAKAAAGVCCLSNVRLANFYAGALGSRRS